MNQFTLHLLWLHFIHKPFGYSPRQTKRGRLGSVLSLEQEKKRQENDMKLHFFGSLHPILHTVGMVVVGNVVSGSQNILSVKAWPSMRLEGFLCGQHNALFLLLDSLSKGLAKLIAQWQKQCDKLTSTASFIGLGKRNVFCTIACRLHHNW
jgi:hypothetical protein